MNDRPAAPPRILVVDEDPEACDLTCVRLRAANYSVETVAAGREALAMCVQSRPHLVIMDWPADQTDAFSLLHELKSRWPTLMVTLLTAHGTLRVAEQAAQHGAFGFLIKPVDEADLLGQVERAIAASTFSPRTGAWRVNVASRNRLMEDRLKQAGRAADSGAPVLLTGRNAAGKALFARAIHAASARRGTPFIAVNCRARIETELQAELWGRETGEFANLDLYQPGAVHAARGGTLLLEEIDCLSNSLQAKLVAALHIESFHFERGGLQVRTDVRFICTTSSDLKQRMYAGQFRRDLYCQITALPIEMAELGRRREDIPLLIAHFLEQATDHGCAEKIYSPEMIERLATTDWPGEVRQLFDLVKRDVALSHDSVASESTKRNRANFYELLARYRIRPEESMSAGIARVSGKD